MNLVSFQFLAITNTADVSILIYEFWPKYAHGSLGQMLGGGAGG